MVSPKKIFLGGFSRSLLLYCRDAVICGKSKLKNPKLFVSPLGFSLSQSTLKLTFIPEKISEETTISWIETNSEHKKGRASKWGVKKQTITIPYSQGKVKEAWHYVHNTPNIYYIGNPYITSYKTQQRKIHTNIHTSYIPTLVIIPTPTYTIIRKTQFYHTIIY